MKKLALITALSLIALSSSASAQIDAGTWGAHGLPVVKAPMPVNPVGR